MQFVEDAGTRPECSGPLWFETHPWEGIIVKGKILFVAGLGVGYLLGTRAGHERYEQIKATASKFWNDPRVQRQVDTVETFVKDKAPDVAEFVSENAKKVVSQVSAKKPATSTAKKPASSTSSSKSTAKSS